ncbi:MAG TPA: VOC family protein [Pirellulales bacterium]|jgi:catechol 2,3-dioxygenase-like lactoylglutathione lyase family enzyme|nr:VOC family protein [Pirellulales bacterium]
MMRVTGILETALYVSDLARSVRFYQELFSFEQIAGDERFRALDVAGRQVLLLFRAGESTGGSKTSGGFIPPHDGHGHLHLAFSINADEWDDWLARLAEQNIAIESRVDWPRGGCSVYFRDSDDHLVELVTPGCWATY